MQHESGWKMFVDLCVEAKTASCLEAVFNLFLTIEEKKHLSSRMQIVQALLHETQSQRDISEELHVSISQITRGSNALKVIDPRLLQFLENYIHKDRII